MQDFNKQTINSGAKRAAVAALATLSLSALSLGTAANAQTAASRTTGHGSSGAPIIREMTGTSSSNLTATASLPGAVQPVLQRAAIMFDAAQSRSTSAPDGARQSYSASAASFRELLSSGRVTASQASFGGSGRYLPVSSMQIADDIRLLRSAAASASGTQAAVLNRAAILYAAGAKELFTAQLREALLGANPGPSRLTSVPRGRNRPLTAAERAAANMQGGVIQPDGSVIPGGFPTLGVTGDSTPSGTVVAPVAPTVVGGPILPGFDPNAPVNPLGPTGPIIVTTGPVVAPPVVTPPVVPPTNP